MPQATAQPCPSDAPGDPLEHALSRPETSRLLQLRVPVITQLAARKMSILAIRKLSVGTILEFDKPIDQWLELMVNNKAVAYGEAVKIGERFGLALKSVCDRAARIQSLGT